MHLANFGLSRVVEEEEKPQLSTEISGRRKYVLPFPLILLIFQYSPSIGIDCCFARVYVAWC